jgi:SAM-dependent methyltransferase
VGTAAEKWAEELGKWGIPPEILGQAPESPWSFSTEMFIRKAKAASADTPSAQAAIAALPEGGSVLDVGCGAGAASVPLATRAGHLVGVDSSREMLDAFTTLAEGAGVPADAIEGIWPDVADRAPKADVVVCHHVFYNVPALPAFAARLTDHARRRVVVELTRGHPRKTRNELWLRFHGLERPEGPTADDAVAVLREMGIEPDRVDWENPSGSSFATLDDLVANLRKELCLTADRDPEIAEAVQGWAIERDGSWAFPPAPLVTLAWPGSAKAR